MREKQRLSVPDVSENFIWTLALIVIIPYLTWINLHRWRSGEISDDSKPVIDKILRSKQPIKYWTILTATVALIVVLIAWVSWNIAEAIR